MAMTSEGNDGRRASTRAAGEKPLKNQRYQDLLAVLGIWGALLVSTPVHATIAEALSIEAMTHAADRIAVVRVEGQSTRFDGRQRIVTDTRLRVEEGVKACEPGEVFELTTLGGSVGDLAMHVAGAAQLEAGTRYVVFARHQNGRYHAVGMSQGTLPVQDIRGEAPRVGPGGQGMSLVGARIVPTRLDALLAEIRTYLRAP